MMGAVADGSQSRGRGVLLVIHFRRILDQQHLLLLARLLSRLRYMRPDQLLIGHIRRLQEAIGRFQCCLIRHLRGQGGGWMLGDGASDGHGSLRATRVTQVHATKGVFSPLQGRQYAARIHLRCSFSWMVLHLSLRNSTTSRRETCDKQSGGRPGGWARAAYIVRAHPCGRPVSCHCTVALGSWAGGWARGCVQYTGALFLPLQ